MLSVTDFNDNKLNQLL